MTSDKSIGRLIKHVVERKDSCWQEIVFEIFGLSLFIPASYCLNGLIKLFILKLTCI